MATTAFKGSPVHTTGDLPAQGSAAPAVELVGTDLAPVERPEGRATLVPESDERETLKDESAEDHFEDASGDVLL